MNRKKTTIIISLILFILLILGWSFYASVPKSDPKKDTFAQCLTDKGVIMYGAYWCPHCQRQKQLFGESFSKINYVECTQEVQRCQEQKINGYPTWIFADGSRIEGEATFKNLAEKSSCQAP